MKGSLLPPPTLANDDSTFARFCAGQLAAAYAHLTVHASSVLTPKYDTTLPLYPPPPHRPARRGRLSSLIGQVRASPSRRRRGSYSQAQQRSMRLCPLQGGRRSSSSSSGGGPMME